MNTSNKTFCILPWIHINANSDGNVLPCCIADHKLPMGNLQNNTVKEVWNSDKYKQLRLNMLNGKECKECLVCYDTENRGVLSFRQSSNENYKHHIELANLTNEDGSLDDINLKYFDIRWSNICNFRCRSCSGTYSSSLAKEEKRKNVFIFAGGENNDKLYNELQPYFEGVEHFYFAGGEPLLTDKHYDILNYLISIGKTDVKLSYNSNLSNLNFKRTPITDLWNKFSSVHVMASLDSWGSRAEYIRDGTEWPVIENNIRAIRKNSPHVNLQMNSVISIFNLYTIPEFLNYLIESKLFDVKTFDPCFYNLVNPSFYSSSAIPDKLKEEIIERLESVKINECISQRITETVSYLKSANYSKELHRQFLEVTETFDYKRNQDFFKTFPELEILRKL